jgi:flagellar basal-body rod protein FlgC
MISGISASLSGLQAYGKRLANTGNNIANLNTESFKKGRVLLSEVQPQGVSARYEKVDVPGPQVFEETADGGEMIELSNVDLSEEITGMMVDTHAFQANIKSLQAADEMTTTLLDIKA